ncbi:MAG TPA: MMPL family transporter, partial [Streptosporangiaceae bacterium]|nr:MMPL family transporter [Streptosporangiaceae bacterium]
MNLLLERLGAFSARRWWIVIIGWVIILGGLLGANRAFGGEYVNDYTVAGTGSAVGLDVLNSTFPQQGGFAGQIVYHAKSGTVAADQDAVNQSVTNVSKLPHVIKAVSPFASSSSGAVSKDGTIAYSSVSWSVNPNSLDTAYLDQLNKAVAPARDAGLQVAYGAGAGQIGQANHDLTSEAIGLSCALVLLLFMFGSLIAAAIPLLSAIFSVLAGLSLLGVLASAMTFPTTAPTIATLLGLGVAVDYGLFLVARHREQLDTGMDVITSAAHSEGTSGAAIVVAGGTVVVSILGLYVSGVAFVGSLGLAAAIVVALTMLAALTLVPAFMGVARGNIRSVTSRVRAHRAGVSGREQAAQTAAATHDRHEHSAFARWGRKVSERPWPWAIGSVAVLVVLAIPLFSITLGQPDNGTNPTSESNRQAYDLLSQGFGVGVNGPLAVVVKLPKQSSSDNQQLLSTMQKNVAATSDVASVTPAQVNSSGTTAVFSVIPGTRPQATQTENLVSQLRDNVLPKSHVTAYVTGTTAGTVDFSERITSRIPWLILAVVAIAFLMLTAAFRSVVIAAKAAVLNLLSIGAAYGVIVAIFQWGWGASLIGLHTTVPIPAYVPMLVFAIVFGLSMDYEVFLLSRVHEAWVATGDPHRSVAIGIGSTARVITTAAAIMVVVFASFVLNIDPTVKMLAIGMAFAVLIDASLVRMMLVPAVMALFGEHAWWMPRWMEPIVPHLQLEGSTEPAPALEPLAEREPEPVAVEEVAIEEAAVDKVPAEPVGAPEAAADAPETG